MLVIVRPPDATETCRPICASWILPASEPPIADCSSPSMPVLIEELPRLIIGRLCVELPSSDGSLNGDLPSTRIVGCVLGLGSENGSRVAKTGASVLDCGLLSAGPYGGGALALDVDRGIALAASAPAANPVPTCVIFGGCPTPDAALYGGAASSTLCRLGFSLAC